MPLTTGKIIVICASVLIVLVLMLAFLFSMPTGSDWGGIVSSALDRGDTSSQTSVQICAGLLNIGSCRSTQTSSIGWRAPNVASGFSSLPVLLILAAAGLSVWFLFIVGIYLFGTATQ